MRGSGWWMGIQWLPGHFSHNDKISLRIVVTLWQRQGLHHDWIYGICIRCSFSKKDKQNNDFTSAFIYSDHLGLFRSVCCPVITEVN